MLAASSTGPEGGAEAREEAEAEAEEAEQEAGEEAEQAGEEEAGEEEAGVEEAGVEDGRDDGRGYLYSERRSESDEDGEEEWAGGRVAARRPARRSLMGGGSSGAAGDAAAVPAHDLAHGAEAMVYELPPELWAESTEAAMEEDEEDGGGASSYVRPSRGRGAAPLSSAVVTDKVCTLTPHRSLCALCHPLQLSATHLRRCIRSWTRHAAI